MENNELFQNIEILKEELSNCKEIIEFKQANQEMVNDHDFLVLSNRYYSLNEEISKLRSMKVECDKKIKEYKEVQKKLYDLDVVKNYQAKYEIAKKVVEEVQYIINKGIVK